MLCVFFTVLRCPAILSVYISECCYEQNSRWWWRWWWWLLLLCISISIELLLCCGGHSWRWRRRWRCVRSAAADRFERLSVWHGGAHIGCRSDRNRPQDGHCCRLGSCRRRATGGDRRSCRSRPDLNNFRRRFVSHGDFQHSHSSVDRIRLQTCILMSAVSPQKSSFF